MTGRSGLCSEKIDLAGHSTETQYEAKYTLRSDLSPKLSVKENIAKAKTTFLRGKVGAFQESLNPLSALSIFETCVIPMLLHGCETWILDHPRLMHGSGEFPS